MLPTTAQKYLEKVNKHKRTYSVYILSKKIIVHPGVMSPKYDSSPTIYLVQMPDQTNKDFLEIGSGSGVISTYIAIHGAKSVTAVDISPLAVDNTQKNFNLHELKDAKVLKSDLFEKVSGTYDTIFFNMPYHSHKPKNWLEHGVADQNNSTLKRFLNNANVYLNRNGRIIIGFSNQGNNELLKKLISKNGFVVEQRFEHNRKDWISFLYILKRK